MRKLILICPILVLLVACGSGNTSYSSYAPTPRPIPDKAKWVATMKPLATQLKTDAEALQTAIDLHKLGDAQKAEHAVSNSADALNNALQDAFGETPNGMDSARTALSDAAIDGQSLARSWGPHLDRGDVSFLDYDTDSLPRLIHDCRHGLETLP